MRKFKVNRYVKRYAYIIGGTAIYAIGVNLFVTPMGYFSSGIVGTSQLIRSALQQFGTIRLPAGIDIAGVLNMCFNIPLFILAYTSISKKVLFRTLVSLAVQTLIFSFCPIPKEPIIEDPLTACLIGGIVTGAGIGLVLQASGTGGGLDILGFYLTMKVRDFSIGKVSIIYNAILYAICAVLFSVETAIYSVIYMVIFSLIIDRTHLQNIKTQVTVLATTEELPKRITHEIGRGVTLWGGESAYTENHKVIFTTVVSKYEVAEIRRIIDEMDPTAFMIINEGVHIKGRFNSHL